MVSCFAGYCSSNQECFAFESETGPCLDLTNSTSFPVSFSISAQKQFSGTLGCVQAICNAVQRAAAVNVDIGGVGVSYNMQSYRMRVRLMKGIPDLCFTFYASSYSHGYYWAFGTRDFVTLCSVSNCRTADFKKARRRLKVLIRGTANIDNRLSKVSSNSTRRNASSCLPFRLLHSLLSLGNCSTEVAYNRCTMILLSSIYSPLVAIYLSPLYCPCFAKLDTDRGTCSFCRLAQSPYPQPRFYRPNRILCPKCTEPRTRIATKSIQSHSISGRLSDSQSTIGPIRY